MAITTSKTSEFSTSQECTTEILQRREQLAQWVASVLSNQTFDTAGHAIVCENPSVPLQAVGSDASFRKYYRVQTPKSTLIAVDAPAKSEDTRNFVNVAKHWKPVGIYVPEVIAVDYQNGFMLQEDLGDTTMQDLLQRENIAAEQYYPGLLATLQLIQKQPPDHLPCYDETLILSELSLYPKWFLSGLLKINTTETKLINQLNSLFTVLASAFIEQPQGTVHRDYHSRNLMFTPDSRIGVIDFQGALNGPLLYDVVSLLRDCYISWPQEKIDIWFSSFIANHPVLSDYDPLQLKVWFDLTGLQRHLKCLGIFARLYLRDGKSGYLNDIPVTFRYVLSVLQQYPQFNEHTEWLRQHIEPIVNERLTIAMEETGA